MEFHGVGLNTGVMEVLDAWIATDFRETVRFSLMNKQRGSFIVELASHSADGRQKYT
jgi:hypothetical protein